MSSYSGSSSNCSSTIALGWCVLLFCHKHQCSNYNNNNNNNNNNDNKYIVVVIIYGLVLTIYYHYILTK